MSTAVDYEKLLWSQDKAFADYAQRAYLKLQSEGDMWRPLYKSLLGFVRGTWDLAFNRYTSKPLTPTSFESIRKELASTLYPAAKKAGFPDTVFTIPVVGTYTTTMGASMLPMPEEFKAACQAWISDDNQLTLSCSWRGEEYSRTVDLNPIAEKVKGYIASYHAKNLNGDMAEETVSGIGDWYHSAVDAAKHIAHTKAAKELWGAVSNRKVEIAAATLALGPGGASAVETAYKAYDTLAAAKNGDEASKAKIANIVDKEAAGDPAAIAAADILRKLNNLINAKSDKVTSVSGAQFSNHKGGGNRVKKGNTTTTDHRKGSTPGSARKYNAGAAVAHSARLPPGQIAQAQAQAAQAQAIADYYRNQNQDDQGDEYYGDDYEDDGDGDYQYDEDVSGWTYNRPYRAPLSSLVNGSPGVSMTLRALYSTGSLYDAPKRELLR